MLQDIELHNFKSHRSTQVHLDESRLHALVGQNSAGKSSILQALHHFSRLCNDPFKKVFAFDNSPDFLVSVGHDKLSVNTRGFWGYNHRQNWEASYSFSKNKNNKWEPTISWQLDDSQNALNGWNEPQERNISLIPDSIVKSLKYSVYLKLVATNLAKPAYSNAITPRVEFDGSGLAPTLDYLRNEAPDHFTDLQEMLKRVVPGVQKLGIRRAQVMINRQRTIEIDSKSISYEEGQQVAGQEVVIDMNTGERIPAHSISEGTILALGLLSVLMNPRQPNLILLDDIDQGLHPKAQRELVSVFKEIAQQNNDLQIVFSTHSPYILDDLDASQIHVLSNANSGFTVSKRLDEHPEIEWAKHTLTTGEFWDAEGEDWVSDETEDG